MPGTTAPWIRMRTWELNSFPWVQLDQIEHSAWEGGQISVYLPLEEPDSP